MDFRHDLTKRARNQLRLRLNSHAQGITLTFNEGELVLQGRVRSYYYKQLAQEAVRSVDGVRQVTNKIHVS